MPPSRATLRLFVAVYPPIDLARYLLAITPVSSLPPHRLVPAEQVHLTLQFIGDRPVTELEQTIESVHRSATGLSAFELAGRRLISLPQRGPSRLLAAETDVPSTLLELKSRLVSRLAHQPRRGRRTYRPHLTLLRFRRPSSDGRLDQPLPDGGVRFVVNRLVLVKSILRSTGALHEVVAQVDLD